MNYTRSFVSFLLAVMLTGCATVPTGPSVMVLPAPGKSFQEFQAEDANCKWWASQQSGLSAQETVNQNTVSGAVVGTVIGAGLGAAIGAVSGNPGMGAAVGAGSGLLGGTISGANGRSRVWMGGATSIRHGLPAVHVREGEPDSRYGAKESENLSGAPPVQ